MNRKFAIAALSLGLLSASAAQADDSLLGALIGGSAGALIGHSIGGRTGTVVGAAVGAAAGAAIADDDHRRPTALYAPRPVAVYETLPPPRPMPVVYPAPVYQPVPVYVSRPAYVAPVVVRYEREDWHHHGHDDYHEGWHHHRDN